MTAIRVYSGDLFSFTNLHQRIDRYRLSDIARSLSNLCRFNGHVHSFYSVAEHCVRVSKMVPPGDAMWGLLHDAPEAYLGDVAYPLKRMGLMENYRKLEDEIMREICDTFELPWEEPATVRLADRLICEAEGAVFVPGWPVTATTPHLTPPAGWPPEVAEQKFLERFTEI